MQQFLLSLREKKIVYLLIIACSIGLATYGYYCIFQKVCKSAVIEKAVRRGSELKLPKGVIYAEVASTPQSRAKGLSGRSHLDPDEGMLFVFEEEGQYGFWMKDMKFPIDIVWINEEGIVVHIERHVSPSSYFDHDPPQTFINKPAAKYVLELADGRAEHYGLYLGTQVIIGE